MMGKLTNVVMGFDVWNVSVGFNGSVSRGQ